MGCTISTHVSAQSEGAHGHHGNSPGARQTTGAMYPPGVQYGGVGGRGAPRQNLPLAPPVQGSCKYGQKISYAQLMAVREEFWSTQVSGSAIMWQNLRSACDAFLADDVVLANAILMASNITTPTGHLSQCFDERGFEYRIPPYMFTQPSDGEPPNASSARAAQSSEPSKSGLEKAGKLNARGVIESAPGKHVKLRIRINPGDFNFKVTNCVTSNDTVLTLKHRIQEITMPPAPKEDEEATLAISSDAVQGLLTLQESADGEADPNTSSARLTVDSMDGGNTSPRVNRSGLTAVHMSSLAEPGGENNVEIDAATLSVGSNSGTNTPTAGTRSAAVSASLSASAASSAVKEKATKGKAATSSYNVTNLSNNGRELPVCQVERQRIMFLGRELRNNETMESLGMNDARIVQVFLRPLPKSATASAPQ